MKTNFAILSRYLKDPATSWSLGTFGAIAEFHRNAGETVRFDEGEGWISAVTDRGGIRIHDHAEIRLIPYETISKIPSAWSQGVMVCLPDKIASLNSRAGVTDLADDNDALLDGVGEIGFDLGFGLPHIDVCVRTNNSTLITALRTTQGTSFLDLPPATVAAIKRADPTRVFCSRLGRIEVAQEIPESGGITPLGPHTHVLPALLGRGREQAANIPVPEGWSIALAFYPPHPLRTGDGSLKDFDRAAFDDFQQLIDHHAPTLLADAKRLAWQLLDAKAEPDAAAVPSSRHARTAFRVALRQWELLNGVTSTSAAWRGECDPTRGNIDAPDLRPDHAGST